MSEETREERQERVKEEIKNNEETKKSIKEKATESFIEWAKSKGINLPEQLKCSCGNGDFHINEEATEQNVLNGHGLAYIKFIISCPECNKEFEWQSSIIITDTTLEKEKQSINQLHQKLCTKCTNPVFNIYAWKNCIDSTVKSFTPERYEIHQMLVCNSPDCHWYNMQSSISGFE